MKTSSLLLQITFATLSLAACTNQNRQATYTVSNRNGTVSIPATEIRVMLGTRWEASAALEDIFGANTVIGSKKVSEITRSLIVDQPVSWGGSCDPYQTTYVNPRDVGWAIWPDQVPGYKPGPKECLEAKTSKESMLPGGSTSRMAWSIRACDIFTSNDAALAVAVGNSGANGSALNTPPTDQQIRDAYDMFHPGVPLPEDVFTTLKGVVTTASQQYPNSPEAWRWLMFTLCSSPSWQIL